ncbi:Conserved_hypothetical protein [Hexamita inflata]|uniref:DNA-directed RNA polymerase III subunit RPC3 n=1 Tax=Hexamita inflata TaxID=28002 RepID=A0AA86Q592_9EUKA|nr:Conserved hypothetical protein [Hexamita inflata]
MNILINQQITKDFPNQQKLLRTLLDFPCQTRQYLIQQAQITAEEFAVQFPILRQFGVAMELEVPIIKNGRLGERRVSVFKAMTDVLVASVLKSVIIPMLPTQHQEVLSHLFAYGRSTLQEIEQSVSSNKTQRQMLTMQPVQEVMAQLSTRKLIQFEDVYTVFCQNSILQDYLDANGLTNAKTSSKQQKKQDFQLPSDLVLIQKLQTNEKNVPSEYFVPNYVYIQKFVQLKLALNNIKSICDDSVHAVASHIAHFSQAHFCEVPQSFNIAEIVQFITAEKNQTELSLITGPSTLKLTPQNIQICLQNLIQIQFLSQSFDHYSMNMDFITQCKINVIQKLVNERYQKEAGRVIKLLTVRKYLDEQQIEYEGIMSHQTCVSILNQLHKDGFLQILTAGKSEWNEKSVNLYSVDEQMLLRNGREMAAKVVAGLLDLYEQVGVNLAAEDVKARAKQVAHALGRCIEVFACIV